MEIKRNEESKTVSLKLNRNRLSYWLTDSMRRNLVSALISALNLVLAAIVAFSRPYDPAARWGALLLAGGGIGVIYNLYLPLGWLGSVYSLPPIIAWSTVLVNPIRQLFPWIGITFAAIFPRRLFRGRWAWALIWFPAVLCMPFILFPPRSVAGFSVFRWRYPDCSPILPDARRCR